MVKKLCRHVEAFMATDPISDADLVLVRELMGWLDNVEEFDTLDNSSWSMVSHAIRNWKKLRHLSFMTEDWSLMIHPVSELMHVPSLRTLELHGASETRVD